MPAFIDLTGKRFHRLLIIERAKTRGRQTYWKCRCDCGNIREYSVSTLINKIKITKSCGCYRREKMKREDAPLNRLIMYFKEGATKRGLNFNLRKEYIKQLTSSPCFYCGKPPSQIFRRSTRYSDEYIYNGIDRLNNSIGYIKGNVVPCCGRCNRAKFQDSPEEFKKLIISIYNHWIKS